MVVSCADPGFSPGGGGGGQKNTLITFFRHQFFLQFYRGVSMVYFKENYIVSGSRGGPTFYRGGGPNFFGGGGGGKC